MPATDSCQRFLFEGLDIRGEIVRLSASFQEVVSNKVYPVWVQSLLGEFLAATVLMSTTIKFDGRLVLQARSEGQIPLIMAECNSRQHLRGIARFVDGEVGGDFDRLLSNATLAITLEPERGESYQGIVPIEGESLADSLEAYFTRSEQLDSRFMLLTQDGHCAGLMLQQLPAQRRSDSESRAEAWTTVSRLLATLTGTELMQLDNEELLYRLFHSYSVKLFPAKSVVHRCSCSRERTARALNAIGEDEVMTIVAEEGVVEVNCEFCARRYEYTEAELRLLFESPTGEPLH